MNLIHCSSYVVQVFVSGSDPQAAGLLLPYLLPVLHTIFALSCLTLQGVVNLRYCGEVAPLEAAGGAPLLLSASRAVKADTIM